MTARDDSPPDAIVYCQPAETARNPVEGSVVLQCSMCDADVLVAPNIMAQLEQAAASKHQARMGDRLIVRFECISHHPDMERLMRTTHAVNGGDIARTAEDLNQILNQHGDFDVATNQTNQEKNQ